MKKYFSLLILAGFYWSLGVLADDGFNPEILEKIQQAQQSLKSNLAETKNCNFPNQASCQGAAYCAELEKNSDSLYLYKNAEGKGAPNFALLGFNHDFEGCFDSPEVRFSDDPLLNNDLLKTVKAAGSGQALVKNQQDWEKEQTNLQPLFEETRQSILNLLEARKNSQNGAEIEKLKERVKLIKLASTNAVLTKKMGISKGCDLPNAWFESETHSLYICPQLLRMPPAALMMTMAHEMGHSIDPCNASGDLYKDGPNYSSLQDIPSNAQSIAKAGKKIGQGVGFDSNPFSSVISCLQTKGSMQIPLPETIAAFANYRACWTVSRNQLMQEGFADWISSQVLKKKVSEIADGTAAKKFAFESQLLFLSTGCPGIQARVSNKLMAQINQNQIAQLKSRCKDLAAAVQDAKHPLTDTRIGRLYLAPKEMQKALNCKPTDAVECK